MENQMGKEEKYGIIIVDMQESFLRYHKPNKIREMVAAQIKLIQAGLNFGVPIAVVEYQNSGATIPQITAIAKPENNTAYFNRKCIPGLLCGGWVFPPISDDAFSDPRLGHWINEKGLTSLLFAGINAESCLGLTAISAFRRGFEVTTSEDLISEPKMDYVPLKSLMWMKSEGVIVEDSHVKLIEILENHYKINEYSESQHSIKSA
jgi:nicotinamidase-related amidase